jgi:hypothetical protein
LQVELHPYLRQDALLEFCHGKGIILTAYSSLGTPDSATILKRATAMPVLMQSEVVGNIAKKLNKSPAAVGEDMDENVELPAGVGEDMDENVELPAGAGEDILQLCFTPDLFSNTRAPSTGASPAQPMLLRMYSLPHQVRIRIHASL